GARTAISALRSAARSRSSLKLADRGVDPQQSAKNHRNSRRREAEKSRDKPPATGNKELTPPDAQNFRQALREQIPRAVSRFRRKPAHVDVPGLRLSRRGHAASRRQDGAPPHFAPIAGVIAS